jgi:hypothetical protein
MSLLSSIWNRIVLFPDVPRAKEQPAHKSKSFVKIERFEMYGDNPGWVHYCTTMDITHATQKLKQLEKIFPNDRYRIV